MKSTAQHEQNRNAMHKSLAVASAVLCLVSLLMVLYYAPREQVMGDVQRIFYFHVAAGWVGGLAFAVAASSGGLYLWQAEERYDDVEYASIEIGLVFTLANILTGSIWAKPVWNTWWTWDPRLVTASVMAVIYVGYLLLRRSLPESASRPTITAGYALLGFLSVPLTFFSIRLFRTIHPVVFVAAMDGLGMSSLRGRMMLTLLTCVLAFSLVYVVFLLFRIRLLQLGRRVRTMQWEQYDRQRP